MDLLCCLLLLKISVSILRISRTLQEEIEIVNEAVIKPAFTWRYNKKINIGGAASVVFYIIHWGNAC